MKKFFCVMTVALLLIGTAFAAGNDSIMIKCPNHLDSVLCAKCGWHGENKIQVTCDRCHGSGQYT